jgi:hypothetical protein
MSGHVRPRVTRWGRLWRGLWPDHNPLRRACDRVEAGLIVALLAAFVVGAPLLAMLAGQRAYSAALRTEHAQRAARHRVPAILLTAAPSRVEPLALTRPLAWARWTGPDGKRHIGDVRAPAGAQAGSTVVVWVDASGRLTGPPLAHSQIRNRVIFTAAIAPAAMAVFLFGAWLIAHRVLDRRRLACWDAEWRVTGPRWTSRRG